MSHAESLIVALGEFIEMARAAESAHNWALEKEQENNDATQDILHIAELAPERFAETDLVGVLHNLRMERRDAKKELEVTDIFAQWARDNKKAIDVLSNKVGQMKKILNRQYTDAYCLKTNAAGQKGEWITHVERKPEDAPLPGQTNMEGFDATT